MQAMRLSKKVLVWGALALGMALAGWTLYATTAAGCNGGSNTSASVQGSNSDIKAVSDGATGGCPAMAKGGACCSGMSKTSGGACCMGAKATSASMAGSIFPEGTTVTKVRVKGGYNFIFTGSDLTAIQKALNDHIQTCNASMKKGTVCPKCTVTANDTQVVLKVRGRNASKCCSGLMAASTTGASTKGVSCPAMQDKENKTPEVKS